MACCRGYCSIVPHLHEIKVGDVYELVPDLRNKNKYVLYYRDLELYLSLGMKLIGFHRILKFKQPDRLKQTLILIPVTERMLPIALKKTFLN